MTDLVVVSLEAWDEVWRRNQHLVSRLLASDPTLRVLFVEPMADPLHDAMRRRRPTRGQAVRPHRDVERLWTMRPVKLLPRRVDPRVDQRAAAHVARAASRLRMASPLLWINDPGAASLARRTGWPALYDITDDWLSADRSAAQIGRLAADEGWLLAHAREIVACSPELVRRKSPGGPSGARSITLIPNAVDVDAYRTPRERPADLPPGRTAVYVGTLHSDRLDVSLCIDTAQRLAGAAILVLVGPDELEPADTERLRNANVRVLGARAHDQVIGYLQHADALVVPHLVTPFTESLDPIKLYEYQAVGRPIVSTPVAGFRDAGRDSVAVATAARFPDAVLEAISAPRVTRPAVVADWNDRARAMSAVLGRLGAGPER